MPRVFLSHRSIPQRGKPSRRKGGDGSWPLAGASNLSLSSGRYWVISHPLSVFHQYLVCEHFRLFLWRVRVLRGLVPSKIALN